MKKPMHQVRKLPKRTTMMLIPNHAGKIRKITYPVWLPRTVSFLLITTITVLSASTVFFSDRLETTQLSLNEERETVAELQLENWTYKQEIASLKDQFQEIDDRLAMLIELENKVLHMVGLETGSDTMEVEDPLVAAGKSEDYFSRQFLLVSRSGDPRSTSPALEDYQIDVEYLNHLIENQTNSMEQLVTDVEDQLEYLDAQPNRWPTQGRITSRFGYRVSPTNRRTTEFHHGLDIANSSGTSIIAAGSGIVTYSGYNGGYGRMVIVSHGYGYTSVYAHNSQNLVEVGDRVEKGDLIARMGRTGRATGSHLHFEIRINGEAVDPLTILQ